VATDELLVSFFPFTATADCAANRDRIATAVRAAAGSGARLLLTPETCLLGYPGAARERADADWCALAEEEDRLHLLAEQAGIVLVLGSASLFGGGIGNDALVCGAVDEPRRYRKRALTPLDREHFVPGEERLPELIAIDGWRIGLTICYEVRFGDCWADLALAGADAFVNIAHMAGPDPDPGTKATVVPQHYGARAAEWATPVVVCNTAAEDRWFDSGLWDARGMQVVEHAEGLRTVALEHRDALHPWYRQIREDALERWRRRTGGA